MPADDTPQFRNKQTTMKIPQIKLLVIAAFLPISYTDATSSSRDISSSSRLVLLDVDNTLYRERYAGIESQIVRGTHSYCKNVLGMEKETADQLYNEFGSTVEGLQQTIWKDLSNDELQEKLDGFYRAVYDNVDPSSILLPDMDTLASSTGYSHASKEERKLTRQLLKFSPLPLALASNSPYWHVYKVLQGLGLAKLSGRCKTFTPDRLPSYPTKHQPEEFFSATSDDENDDTSLSKDKLISFLDDSRYNLQRVKEAFPLLVDRVHHINRRPENDDSDGSNN